MAGQGRLGTSQGDQANNGNNRSQYKQFLKHWVTPSR
jgi:hypothetical protein